MAIDDLLDEHEQGERVRAWLRQNGAALVGGIAIGLAAIGGWKWWGAQQEQQALAAADQYHAAVAAIEAGADDAQARIQGLAAGPYRQLARLELAASQVEAGDAEAAIATLRAVEAGDPLLDEVVEHRLARLLIEAGKPGEALQLVSPASGAAAGEIRGDAHFALEQVGEARDAYQAALQELDPASPRRGILELKLTQVGGVPATTEPEASS